MTGPALVFEDVCFAYDRDEVLHNVSLAVDPGSLVAMVGPNGGGKSTLVRTALGLLVPQRGRVTVLGTDPVGARSRVGYVPQHLAFDPAFPVSVTDVVLMGRVERHRFGCYRRADRAAARAALEQVAGGHLARRPFAELSGGERQRVLVAQALAAEPELLLLDEPTANVDAQVERELYELLHSLAGDKTIVAVSHNLSVVTRHATHVICVNRTASIAPMSAFSGAALDAGDLAVLQHEASCHVLDASHAMHRPHLGHDHRGRG